MRVAFLLSKDPTTAHGGDVALQRVLVDLARADHDVVLVCQSPDVTAVERGPDLVRVPKDPVDLPRLVARSLRRGRSLVHLRYDSDAYVAALDGVEADAFVVDHSYMAEPFLRSRHAAAKPLLVSTSIQESTVWAQTRGLPGRLEARRIARDELRVARAARSLATYDEAEAEDYRRLGVERVTWLEVTLPPVAPVDVTRTPPRLVFLGHREWPPNAHAAGLVRAWWPQISAGIPDAELWIVGPPPRGGPGPSGGGIRDLGFVDDLPAVLAGSRALAAPIEVGGGVRVKILDAAARGLPVVSTTPGIGSLAGALRLTPYDGREAFVQRCRTLLLDVDAAAADGARLHAANVAHWESGRPRRSFDAWLGA